MLLYIRGPLSLYPGQQPLQTDQGQIWSTFGWKHSKKNPGATGRGMGDAVGGDLSSESFLDQLPSVGQGSGGRDCHELNSLWCTISYS